MSQTELLPCPFCGGVPKTIERPDNIDGTEFFYAVACYCGGYSACAHKMAKRKTPEQAKADAIAAWNRRSSSLLLDREEAGGEIAENHSVHLEVPTNGPESLGTTDGVGEGS